MTLQKAIESLTFLSREGTQDLEFDDYNAIKLGIEALKWYQGQKERRGQSIWLLGETES